MVSRVSESVVYRHLWTTPRSDAIFSERARLQSWIGILAALAQAQEEAAIVPPGVSAALRAVDPDALDLDRIAGQTRATGHSTLGLIQVLQAALPGELGEYVYYGATVQDLTDTWFGLVMRDVAAEVLAGVLELEQELLTLAVAHRATAMTGRTHGQAGAPIPFGLKVATWADELRRHAERLGEGELRWAVGQLGGAVGALGYFGPRGPALRERFCELLDLRDPVVSWCTSRDRLVEFAGVLVLVGGTLARIGTEVLELQRPEIDELREAATPTGVGSITMPHKRNPETAEHLDTLSRLARSQLSVLADGLTGLHERDGRSWKAEWVALPEVCILTMTALALAAPMVAGLEVDAESMQRNLIAHGPAMGSEQLLAGLSARVGKQRAQAQLQTVFHDESGARRAWSKDALVQEISRVSAIEPEDVREWLHADALAAGGLMIDAVVRRAVSEQRERL